MCVREILGSLKSFGFGLCWPAITRLQRDIRSTLVEPEYLGCSCHTIWHKNMCRGCSCEITWHHYLALLFGIIWLINGHLGSSLLYAQAYCIPIVYSFPFSFRDMSLTEFGVQMGKFFARGENVRAVSGSPATTKTEGAKEPPFSAEQAESNGCRKPMELLPMLMVPSCRRNSRRSSRRCPRSKGTPESRRMRMRSAQQVSALQVEVKELQSKSSLKCDIQATPPGLHSSPSTNRDGSIPFEARTIATCGNLGYDTQPSELESRCRTLLNEIGFTDDQVTIAAKYRGKGSVCEVGFTSADMLRLQGSRSRQLGRSMWKISQCGWMLPRHARS